MGKSRFALGALLVFAGMCGVSGCTDMLGIPGEGKTVYRQWKQGPSAEASFFPIAVWLQDPVDAEKYKAAGINTYVALWEGPTEEQLEMLRKAGIGAFCEVNDVARKHMNDPVIVGWMHGDEPDNAQTSPGKDAAGK